MSEFFKRSANRICICFEKYGLIEMSDDKDDIPIFFTSLPIRVGDEAVIFAEGKVRNVILLRSIGHCKNSTYLVDMGENKNFTHWLIP